MHLNLEVPPKSEISTRMPLRDYFGYTGPFSIPCTQTESSWLGNIDLSADDISFNHHTSEDQAYLSSPFATQELNFSHSSPTLVTTPATSFEMNDLSSHRQYNDAEPS